MGGTVLSSHGPRWTRAQFRAAFPVFGITPGPPARRVKSRLLTFPITPVAAPEALWQALRDFLIPVVQVPNGVDGYGSLCRAGEFHRSGNPQRQGVAEARRRLQSDGEDVRSDCEGTRLDTGTIRRCHDRRCARRGLLHVAHA